MPAAICGVTGFKPTYGLISTRGILEGEDAGDEMIVKLSHGAVQCRSVADARLLLDVLAQPLDDVHDEQGYGTRLGERERLRIGIVTTDNTPDVEAAFRKAVAIIVALWAHRCLDPVDDGRSGAND